jgi:hypothetical protein
MSQHLRLTNLRVAEQPNDGPSLLLRPEEVTDFRMATLVVTKDGRWYFVNEEPIQVLVQLGNESQQGVVYLRDDFIEDAQVKGWSRDRQPAGRDPLDAVLEGGPPDALV